jgi:hypothetical protein
MSPGPIGYRGSVGGTESGIKKRTDKYMQMQLDLNEQETGYYEGVANDLLDKLDRITEERDGLQILCEEVQREREELLFSIEGLKMDSLSKDEEVKRASLLLDDMHSRIDQSDRLIDQIRLERDIAVARLGNGEGGDSEGGGQLLFLLEDAERKIKEYEVLLEGKNEEVAFAEASLVEIQTHFEEARKNLPKSAKSSTRGRDSTGSTRGSEWDTPTAIPFDLGAGGVQDDFGDEGDSEEKSSRRSSSGIPVRARTSLGGGREKVLEVEGERLLFVIEQRDQQIMIQTSQLGALQDSLGEQKAANALMKQQKMTLKEMQEVLKEKLSAMESEYTTLIAVEFELRGKVDEVVGLLRAEVYTYIYMYIYI